MQNVLAVSLIVVTVQRSTQQDFPSGNSGNSLQQDSSYRKVRCDFQEGNLCGWADVYVGYQLTWKTADESNGNYYAHLDVNYRYGGEKGGLASPWLQPKPAGYTCQLEFKYYIQWSSRCKLSLFRQMETEAEELWRTTTSSGSSFSGPVLVDVGCTQGRYRMVFQGERLSDYLHCGEDYFNGIDVDDIVYHLYPAENPICTSTTTRSPTTTLAQANTTQTSDSTATSPSSDKPTSSNSSITTPTPTEATTSDNDTAAAAFKDSISDGLEAGQLAGIVIAVVAVIVVVAMMVTVLVRRRGNDGAQTSLCFTKCFKKGSELKSASTHASHAITNDADLSNDQQVSALDDPPARPRGDNTHIDHVYTVPDNIYVNLSNDNDSPNRGDELLALALHPQGASSSDRTHLHLKGSNVVTSTATTDNTSSSPGEVAAVYAQIPKGRKIPSEREECSALHGGQRSRPSTAAEGNAATVYENTALDSSHFGGTDHSRKGRRQDHDEHSLTQAVDTSSSPDEAAAVYIAAGTTDYETVDDDGKLVTSPSVLSDDVYNRLRRSAGRSVEQKVHQNHYDHFNDPAGTGPEYSSLDHGDRARDQQREMAASEYSHI